MGFLEDSGTDGEYHIPFHNISGIQGLTALPPIFVISLLDALPRRSAASSQLRAVTGLEWHFVEAVDGRQWSEESMPDCYDPVVASRIVGFALSGSELACFMSHQAVWRLSIAQNRPVVVLEDDFRLQRNFLDSLKAAMQLYDEWDIFRLQGLSEVKQTTIQKVVGGQVVRQWADPVGATAYIIKPETAQVLLYMSEQIYEPVDHFLEHYRYHRQRVLAISPYSVEITGFPSTITERPDLRKIRGMKKARRSFYRMIFRMKLFFSHPGARW